MTSSAVSPAGGAKGSAQDTPGQTLLGVQYLRGVAAMLVVLIHLQEQLQRVGISLGLVNYGSAGVDIFFVISGFVMWHTTVKPTSTRNFYFRRIIRIVPLYWLLTSLMLAILLLAPILVKSGALDWGHVVASYFFIAQPHPAIADSMFPLLVPGWTLNYEMYFYLLFGLMLPLPPLARVITVTAVFSLLAVAHVFAPDGASMLGFYTDPIILEFAAGAMLGYAIQRGAWLPRGVAITLLLFGAVLIAAQFDAHRLIRNGVGSILIVTAVVLGEIRRPIRRYRLPLLIGDASYSIYLSHAILLSALFQIYGRLFDLRSPVFAALYIAGAVVAVIIAGALLFRFFEQPSLTLLRHMTRSKESSQS
ncbi:acyltransferase family protein [Sphingomonas sp. LT1P40]|uniref:acyltransferase family protein n=1 Tax=Alteristakelama amylovorans TaxID=3096166 RepID=UPI002FCA17EA